MVAELHVSAKSQVLMPEHSPPQRQKVLNLRHYEVGEQFLESIFYMPFLMYKLAVGSPISLGVL